MPNVKREGAYRLPPIIQALSNSMFKAGQSKYKIHRRVAFYLDWYCRGESEEMRQISRDQVRRKLCTYPDVVTEYNLIKEKVQ